MSVYRVLFHTSNNEDWVRTFALKDASKNALDLTGATFSASLKNTAGTAVLQLSTANGRLVVETPATGVLKILVAASDLSAVPAGTYKMDMLMTLSGRIRRIMFGEVKVAGGVT